MATTPQKPVIAAIWAQDKNGVLGTGTDMCWHVPADFKHFKNTTMGDPIIMGRNSFEALGKPLPGRVNIVMTRQNDYSPQGVVVVHDLQAAIDAAAQSGGGRIWITGGSAVYHEAMPLVDELIITDLDLQVYAESGQSLVYAPEISEAQWQVDAENSDAEWREKSGDARWRVTTYRRRSQ